MKTAEPSHSGQLVAQLRQDFTIARKGAGLPARVLTAIACREDASEVLIKFLQLAIVVVFGVLYALALGFIGGLLPSVRAARLPVVVGLRAT